MKLLILNGSPRAPRSNSKRYAELVCQYWKGKAEVANLLKGDTKTLCRMAGEADHVLLVFPLYADGLPTVLLAFLKEWEQSMEDKRPTVSVLINCCFYEPEQNAVAVDMVRLFCRKTGCPFGSVLKIGSGEAILDSPFRFMVKWKTKQLARAMERGRGVALSCTMPISKGMFLKASTNYWIRYGAKFGRTAEELDTMEIEEGTYGTGAEAGPVV